MTLRRPPGALVLATLSALLLGLLAPTTPADAVPSRARDEPRVLFFGDSYVIGGPYAGPERTMAALAAQRLGWSWVLAGGGGTGFATANPEFGLGDFLAQVKAGALDVGPVDWLVVEGGSNDRFLDPALVTRRATRTLRQAQRRHPEARVVLMGTFDAAVADLTDTDAVTEALRAASVRAGVPFVDAQHWLEDRPDLVGPDFDHPTAAGNRLLARRLAAALTRLADQPDRRRR